MNSEIISIETLEKISKLKKENKELEERINKAIEELEKEKRSCPASLTLEKAYIIEVKKITKVLSILRGGEDNE